MRRKRRGLANEGEQRLAQGKCERDACEHVGALRDGRRRRDPRRRPECAGDVSACLDPRVMGPGDALNRDSIVRHDRALKVERRCELTRPRAQVGAHGCEGGCGDPRTARELGGRLLGVGPICVPVEREDDRRQQRAGQ